MQRIVAKFISRGFLTLDQFLVAGVFEAFTQEKVHNLLLVSFDGAQERRALVFFLVHEWRDPVFGQDVIHDKNVAASARPEQVSVRDKCLFVLSELFFVDTSNQDLFLVHQFRHFFILLNFILLFVDHGDSRVVVIGD